MVIFRSKEELKHYASKYYDPVKAREYYLRTRELKGRAPGWLAGPEEKAAPKRESAVEYFKRTGRQRGRRSVKSLNDEGKARWTDVKAEIAEQKRRETAADTKRRQATIKAFRDGIRTEQKAREKRNKDYLKSQLKSSMNQEKQRIEALSKTNVKELKKVQRIPRSASPEQKERMREQNDRIRDENDKIREDNRAAKERNNEEKAKVRESFRDVRTNYKEESREIMDGIKEQYKEKISSGVERIKESFAGNKESIRQEFENILDTAYDELLSQYGADTNKGQNTGAGRSAAEKKKIRQDLAEERKKKKKK